MTCDLEVDQHGPGGVAVEDGEFELTVDRSLGIVVRGTFDSALAMHGSWDGFRLRSGRCGVPIGMLGDPQPGGTFSATRSGACSPVAEDCPNPSHACRLDCGHEWSGYRCDIAPFMPRQPGELCYSRNDCTRGHTCAQIGGINRCFRACQTDADCGGTPCTPTQIECGGQFFDSGFGACRGTASYDAAPPIDIVDADAQ
jgi:hypothetical protein